MVAKRTNNQPPQQRNLFVESEGSDIKTWQDLADTPSGRLEAITRGNIGPHSNVVERAERIIGIFDKISNRNSLQGLSYGVEVTKYKKPIWQKYLNGTPQVIKNSRKKVERLNDELTVDIAELSGTEKLRGLGLLTVREAIFWLEMNDRDFMSLYGPTYRVQKEHGIRPLRKDYRKVQLGFLPDDHPLKKKQEIEPTDNDLVDGADTISSMEETPNASPKPNMQTPEEIRAEFQRISEEAGVFNEERARRISEEQEQEALRVLRETNPDSSTSEKAA